MAHSTALWPETAGAARWWWGADVTQDTPKGAARGPMSQEVPPAGAPGGRGLTSCEESLQEEGAAGGGGGGLTSQKEPHLVPLTSLETHPSRGSRGGG